MVIEMGKTCHVRLQTHPHFGGTWLFDYARSLICVLLELQFVHLE